MPSLDQETYDLYSDQLKSLKLGHAIYEPEPNEGEGEVQIGDVGYIKYGRFMPFASVFTSEHGIPAVDDKYRLITKLGKLDKGVMSSRSVHSEKVEFELSASVLHSIVIAVTHICSTGANQRREHPLAHASSFRARLIVGHHS